MVWQVIEYVDNNPQADMMEIVQHFADELEIDDQTKYLRNEVDHVLELRETLRPLYGKKADLEQKQALLNSDFDMEVMLEYPPRKGSEKERKAMKQKLQEGSDDYQEQEKELGNIKEELSVQEEKMDEVQQRAKNARRLLETFTTYVNFILDLKQNPKRPQTEEESAANNADVF